MKIGEIIKIGKYDCTILDITKSEVLLWCDTKETTSFGDSQTKNKYTESLLFNKCQELENYLINTLKLPIIKRDFSISPIRDKETCCYIYNVAVAPLTYKEYTQYKNIFKSRAYYDFWLCNPLESNNSSYIGTAIPYGEIGYGDYNAKIRFSPVFNISKSYFNNKIK